MFYYFKLNKLFNNTNKFTQKPSVAQSNICKIILKADTGTGNHYIRPTDATFLKKIKITTNLVQNHLPNNMTLTSIKEGMLPVNVLNQTAKCAHILPLLTNAFLLSISQLCDNNYMALFNKKDMIIYKNGQIVLRGKCNFFDELWDVPFNTKSKQIMANMTAKRSINMIQTRVLELRLIIP